MQRTVHNYLENGSLHQGDTVSLITEQISKPNSTNFAFKVILFVSNFINEELS